MISRFWARSKKCSNEYVQLRPLRYIQLLFDAIIIDIFDIFHLSMH